jgi:hypothetical protein
MDVEKMREKLITAARKMPQCEQVPCAFPKRIMARIGRATPLSGWALWARPLWSAAVSCMAITLLCALWSLAAQQRSENPESFLQDFEQTVLSPVNQHLEESW